MPSTLRHELARKTIHIASATVPVTYALGAPRTAVIAALGGAGVIAASIEIARVRSARVRSTFERLVGALLRPHEHGRWSGATWMCAAYLLATLAFPQREAVAAMLAVAFGDAAAAVVGRLAAGRPNAGKTWIGSIACWSATTLGALLVARVSAPAAVACGAAAMLAERPRSRVDDNVRVALAAGATAWGVAWMTAWATGWLARGG